jgi:Fumarylacetoacetate (FAA) hydrolase family
VFVNHAPLAIDLAVDVGYPQLKCHLLTAFQCPADPLELVAVAKGRAGGDDEIAEPDFDRPVILIEESLIVVPIGVPAIVLQGRNKVIGRWLNVFFHMKPRDTFAPIGPFPVTKDEIANVQEVPIKLWVNGTLKQNFNTNDMAHSVARCIEWVTSIHTLEPGDILATGTNHRGLSSFMDGGRIELECSGLGRLNFNIRDDLKRTWSRETRLDRQRAGKGPDAAGRRQIRVGRLMAHAL